MASRRRKKSLPTRMLREATRSLPAPVQVATATPLRLLLSTSVLATLVSYGVIKVNWDSGRPKLEVNKEKAAELKERTKDWVGQVREPQLHAEPPPPDVFQTAQQAQGAWTTDPRGVRSTAR